MTEQEIRNVFEDTVKRSRSYNVTMLNKDRTGDYISQGMCYMWYGFHTGFLHGRESTQEPMGS